MKKYEFTGEIKTDIFGRTIHRIKALIEIKFPWATVEVGALGGWIEKEDNLSHDGNAWVYGDAEVFGNARVYDDAEVYGNAEVSGNTWVYGNVEVCGNARVYGNAEVFGNAKVFGNTRVYGDAEVYGDVEVSGNATVSGDMCACNTDCYLVMGPMGSRNAFVTFGRNKSGEIKIRCGCFFGNVEEFLAKVEQTHGDNKHALAYRAAVQVALEQIDTTPIKEGE